MHVIKLYRYPDLLLMGQRNGRVTDRIKFFTDLRFRDYPSHCLSVG
jgi:hypothetical protein